MGKNSGVEWADHSWSPWKGCHRVSDGCTNCYAFRDMKRYGQQPGVVQRTSRTTFNAPLRWEEPARVFVCPWSDFFIEEADEWRDDAWEIMRRTPHLTYLILTKRPENIAGRLPANWNSRTIKKDGAWAHVRLGVSVESQKYGWRIWELLYTPAPGYFLSAEPMLGSVDLRPIWWDWPRHYMPPPGKFDFWDIGYRLRGMDWVICGCESGGEGKRRRTDISWVRDLRDQCAAANVPFFLKQLEIDGRIVKMPELDGKAWAQVPEGW